MNYNIDFGTIPKIHEKISSGEIQKLNDIFQQPEIVEKLKEIEMFRKKRQKVLAGVTLFLIILTSVAGFLIGKTAAVVTGSVLALIFAGIFYRTGDGDSSFGLIEGIGLISALMYGGVYNYFRNKIEIPLKRDVMSKLCVLLDPNFKYSYDEKYSFDDVGMLFEKNFLQKFSDIDMIEDSVQLHVKQGGKTFVLHGFELQTSIEKGSGKNKKQVVTNHDYLMKIEFPHARIPISKDMSLVPKTSSHGSSKIWLVLVGILAFFGIYLLLSLSVRDIIVVTLVVLSIAILGFLLTTKFSKKKNKIQLENVDFSKKFNVYCDDEIGSRMILTTAFMDRLVSLVEQRGNHYNFLFMNNTVYIKKKLSKNYMEVKTSKNMFKNIQGFLDFYIDMREIVMLSRELHMLYLSKTTNTITDTGDILKKNTPLSFNTGLLPVSRGFFGKKRKKQ